MYAYDITVRVVVPHYVRTSLASELETIVRALLDPAAIARGIENDVVRVTVSADSLGYPEVE